TGPLARSIGIKESWFISKMGSETQVLTSRSPESVILIFFRGFRVINVQPLIQTLAEIPERKDDIDKVKVQPCELDKMPIPGPWT
uniref:Uncharacterized protein n=1 Tax=Myripristis murdjan TaxID=586833 RepID=A0A667ZGR3_9TELE